MLFEHTWQLVRSGQKTQSRRLAQPGDEPRYNDPEDQIIQVIRLADANVPKVLYEVGKSYAVQPGPAKKSVTRIVITAIRQERLQDISESDALKEFPNLSLENDLTAGEQARQAFSQAWDSWHDAPGTRWQDNPSVWVLEFKLPFSK